MPPNKKRHKLKRIVTTETTEDAEEEAEEVVSEEKLGEEGPTALIAPEDYVDFMKNKKVKNKPAKPARVIVETELPTILVGPADYKNFMTNSAAVGKQKKTTVANRTVMNEAELPTVLMSKATPADYINYTPGFLKPQARKENIIPDDAPTALVENLLERENRRPRKAKEKQSPNKRTPLRNRKKKVVRWTTTETVSRRPSSVTSDEQTTNKGKRERRKKRECCCVC